MEYLKNEQKNVSYKLGVTAYTSMTYSEFTD